MKPIHAENRIRSVRPRVEQLPSYAVRGQTVFPGLAPVRVSLKKILVPIDFSAESKDAIHYALPLAKELGGTITLLHVAEPITFPADYGYGPVIRQISDKAGMRKAKARLKSLGQRMIRPEMLGETIVLSGEACFEITEAARAIEADLIIVGSHGSDGATGGVGSTAERVIWHAPCAVFVLRKKEQRLAAPTPVLNKQYEMVH